jgi:hypothetical protein
VISCCPVPETGNELLTTALPATAETVAEYVRHLTVTPTARRGTSRSPSSIERALVSAKATPITYGCT